VGCGFHVWGFAIWVFGFDVSVESGIRTVGFAAFFRTDEGFLYFGVLSPVYSLHNNIFIIDVISQKKQVLHGPQKALTPNTVTRLPPKRNKPLDTSNHHQSVPNNPRANPLTHKQTFGRLNNRLFLALQRKLFSEVQTSAGVPLQAPCN
jgi:hypothetical protein